MLGIELLLCDPCTHISACVNHEFLVESRSIHLTLLRVHRTLDHAVHIFTILISHVDRNYIWPLDEVFEYLIKPVH